MFTPTGFDSRADYFRFMWARKFLTADRRQEFTYAKSKLEILGEGLSKPALGLTNYALQNIRNPLMITALTLAAIGVTTILFYPDQFVRQVVQFMPFALCLKAWMIKAGLYAATQMMIIGVGLRTLGRLNNLQLRNAWAQRQVIPIFIGTELIRFN